MSGDADFSAAAFAELIAAELVDDARSSPSAASFGDAGLNPGPAPRRTLRDAAVLFGVVDHPGEASVILTRRTDHLTAHAGQIALPGGKVEADDAGPVGTALREAEEEIGLDPSSVRPLGCFPAYVSNSGFRIVPVIAVVRPGLVLHPDPSEVADVFEVPLGFLMSGENHRVGHRVWQGERRYFYEMPWGDRYIWGVTAGIVRKIFERTWGRGAPPAPGTPPPGGGESIP